MTTWLRVPAVVALVSALAACGHEGLKGETRTLTVPSSAMEPTLHCARPAPGCRADYSDKVVVQVGVQPRRGDIAVFKAPPRASLECGAGGNFVKRVVGLPGERIQERDGWFYVNGRKLDDSAYVKPRARDDRTGYWVVPKGEDFFVGDNRTQSCDSRRFGGVARSDIAGKVVAIKRPSGRIELP